jgi:hypothetical protein
VLLDRKVPKATPVIRELKAFKDRLALMERLALPAPKVLSDRRAFRAFLVLTVLTVQTQQCPDLPARRVSKVQ